MASRRGDVNIINQKVSFLNQHNSVQHFWNYKKANLNKPLIQVAHQTGIEPVTCWLTTSYCYLSQLLANYHYFRDVNTRLLLFNAEAFNDLIEYQFNNIVKLMSGLGMGESIQEKVLKELSANLASLMVVENWGINDSEGNCPTISSQLTWSRVIHFPFYGSWVKVCRRIQKRQRLEYHYLWWKWGNCWKNCKWGKNRTIKV